MQSQLENRLQDLRQEFEKGQKRLADLNAEATELKETLLRISGAIQVIEEFLASESGSE